MFNSLQELNKKKKTENTKMQSYLDFLFLVNACINVHLLTRLYMSILFVVFCAHEPELTWRKEAIAEAQIAVFTKCQETSLLHVFTIVAGVKV